MNFRFRFSEIRFTIIIISIIITIILKIIENDIYNIHSILSTYMQAKC